MERSVALVPGRYEESEDGLNKATEANLKLIRATLEAAGIEFIGDATEGPGARLWSKPQP